MVILSFYYGEKAAGNRLLLVGKLDNIANIKKAALVYVTQKLTHLLRIRR